MASLNFSDGTYNLVPFGSEEDYEDQSHCCDCSVEVGQFHHPQCNQQQCPRCMGKFAYCDCEIKGVQCRYQAYDVNKANNYKVQPVKVENDGLLDIINNA